MIKNPLVKKVLLIGWDAADWRIIEPLIAAGGMPTFKKFLEAGVSGKISTLDPPYSPMLWTSVATGKTADKHGILGFIEPDPHKMAVRPVTSTSRKVRAIWNMLHNQGMRSNIVNWWPSYPAEPIKGAMVSNFFVKRIGTQKEPLEVKQGMVFPESFAEKIVDLRMYPEEVTAAHILPFMPRAADINREKDKGLYTFIKIFSESITTHATSTWLAEHSPWDFMAVYFDCIDHYCHAFMKYHPPKLAGFDEDLFDIYKDVVNSGYRFQDMMLERMLEIAGEDTTVIIMSDHGFQSTDSRMSKMPDLPAAPALEHRKFGIVAMKGPGIRKGGLPVFGASLLDITPTILTLFGLPVGRDMDGKPLVDAFDQRIEPRYIDSWEEVEGDFGMIDAEHRFDVSEANDAINQLVELGYVEKPDEDVAKQVERTKDDMKYNLARVKIGRKDYKEGERLLLELINKNPSYIYLYLELVVIYIGENRFTEARGQLDIVKELNEGNKDKSVINIELIEAKILIGEGETYNALELLKSIEKKKISSVSVHFELGKTFLQLDKYADAEISFKRALELDGDYAVGHHGLAISLIRQDKVDEAMEAALNAVELVRNFPQAHATLGEIFKRKGMTEEAKQAYNLSLMLNEQNERAKKALMRIDRKMTVSEENGDKLPPTDWIAAEEVIVVSGLPRSGTSMMMQLLDAGGIKILKDEMRTADQNNPKGYYEFEPVKSLARDNTWIEQARGKGVKVIAQLLRHLPPQYFYKVIFMQREMEEVLKSQQIMLKRDPENYPFGLADAYKTALNQVAVWEKKEPGVEMLYLNYSEVVKKPEEAISSIKIFLNRTLDEGKMKTVIDRNLYRNIASG